MKLQELRNQKTNNKGFSLVELIIVIAIMAVLIAILAPQFIKYVEKSRRSSDIDNVSEIISAVQSIYADEDADVYGNNYYITIAKDGSSGVAHGGTGTDTSCAKLVEALGEAQVSPGGVKLKSKWGVTSGTSQVVIKVATQGGCSISKDSGHATTATEFESEYKK